VKGEISPTIWCQQGLIRIWEKLLHEFPFKGSQRLQQHNTFWWYSLYAIKDSHKEAWDKPINATQTVKHLNVTEEALKYD